MVGQAAVAAGKRGAPFARGKEPDTARGAAFAEASHPGNGGREGRSGGMVPAASAIGTDPVETGPGTVTVILQRLPASGPGSRFTHSRRSGPPTAATGTFGGCPDPMGQVQPAIFFPGSCLDFRMARSGYLSRCRAIDRESNMLGPDCRMRTILAVHVLSPPRCRKEPQEANKPLKIWVKFTSTSNRTQPLDRSFLVRK